MSAVADEIVTYNYDHVYEVIRVEEVPNGGLRSAVLCSLNAGEYHERSISAGDLNKLKKVSPRIIAGRKRRALYNIIYSNIIK